MASCDEVLFCFLCVFAFSCGYTEPEPFAVGVDPNGKFVYAGNANDVTEPGPTSLSGFRIGTHGALTPVPGSPFFPPAPVPSFPISIVITSSGKAD